jgi:hypothetical protein
MLDAIARHLIETGRLMKFMEPKPEKKDAPTPKKKAPRKRIEKDPNAEDEEDK